MKHLMKIEALFMNRNKIRQIVKKAKFEILNMIIQY